MYIPQTTGNKTEPTTQKDIGMAMMEARGVYAGLTPGGEGNETKRQHTTPAIERPSTRSAKGITDQTPQEKNTQWSTQKKERKDQGQHNKHTHTQSKDHKSAQTDPQRKNTKSHKRRRNAPDTPQKTEENRPATPNKTKNLDEGGA